MYKSVIRSILFKFDPEAVHYFTFNAIRILSKIPFVSALIRSLFLVKHPALERELFGLKFKNPVGLAAGFDKNAVLYEELTNFGFGFIEIGTSVSCHNIIGFKSLLVPNIFGKPCFYLSKFWISNHYHK